MGNKVPRKMVAADASWRCSVRRRSATQKENWVEEYLGQAGKDQKLLEAFV
jgi:hypothetical protein